MGAVLTEHIRRVFSFASERMNIAERVETLLLGSSFIEPTVLNWNFAQDMSCDVNGNDIAKCSVIEIEGVVECHKLRERITLRSEA